MQMRGFPNGRRPSGSMVVAMAAVVIACAGSATAASLITGKQIKDGSLTGADLKNRSLGAKDLSRHARDELEGRRGPRGAEGPTGARGPAGPQGATGPQGPPGAAATFSAAKWGVIARNVYGSPVADLRVGPWGRAPGADAATEEPPYGIGSLGLAVNDAPTGAPESDGEKASFGNETDFAGLDVSAITALSVSVFATAEGSDDPAEVSMPNIAIEVDPDVSNGPTPVNYTSLVYLPPQPSETNRWQSYDATAVGAWFASGTAGTVTGCTGIDPCSFADLSDALGPDAEITLSVAIAKGRDGTFVGAVDGLRVNDTVYDFEPLGVRELPVP
jgi:hypothetical protein